MKLSHYQMVCSEVTQDNKADGRKQDQLRHFVFPRGEMRVQTKDSNWNGGKGFEIFWEAE